MSVYQRGKENAVIFEDGHALPFAGEIFKPSDVYNLSVLDQNADIISDTARHICCISPTKDGFHLSNIKERANVFKTRVPFRENGVMSSGIERNFKTGLRSLTIFHFFDFIVRLAHTLKGAIQDET